MALPAQVIEDITFFSFRFHVFMSLRSLATTVHLPLSHWRNLYRAALTGPLISRLFSLVVLPLGHCVALWRFSSYVLLGLSELSVSDFSAIFTLMFCGALMSSTFLQVSFSDLMFALVMP